MSGTEFQFTCLTDPRLAAHALSPTPVWLWSTDATRVLWANPIAAAIFDAASPGALAALSFEPEHAGRRADRAPGRHAAAGRRAAA